MPKSSYILRCTFSSVAASSSSQSPNGQIFSLHFFFFLVTSKRPQVYYLTYGMDYIHLIEFGFTKTDMP